MFTKVLILDVLTANLESEINTALQNLEIAKNNVVDVETFASDTENNTGVTILYKTGGTNI